MPNDPPSRDKRRHAARNKGESLIMTDRVILGCTVLIAVGLSVRDHADSVARNRRPAGPQGFSPPAGSRAPVGRGHAGHGDLEERGRRRSPTFGRRAVRPGHHQNTRVRGGVDGRLLRGIQPAGLHRRHDDLPARPDGVVQPRQVAHQCPHVVAVLGGELHPVRQARREPAQGRSRIFRSEDVLWTR